MAIEFRFAGRPAPRCGDANRRRTPRSFGQIAVASRRQAFAFFQVGFRHDRPFVLDPVDHQQREDRAAFVVEQLVAGRPVLRLTLVLTNANWVLLSVWPSASMPGVSLIRL